MHFVLALEFNYRVVTTLAVAAVWMAVALVAIPCQFSNRRAADFSYRYWAQAQPPVSARIWLTARINRRHNRGRLLAVCLDALAGLLILVSPFVYDTPRTPLIASAALIGALVSLLLFTVELVLGYVSVMEWLDRRRLYGMLVPDELSLLGFLPQRT